MITRIKNHVLQHGDLMDGVDLVMGADRAQIFYSDPPWGSGNLKYWQTLNVKQTGVAYKEIDFDSFLDKVLEIAVKFTDEYIIIEYGKKWHNLLLQKAMSKGLIQLGVARVQYRSGNHMLPLDIHIFSKKDLSLPDDYITNINETSSITTVRNAIYPLAHKGKIILDPSCGMGYTARVGIEAGMYFRGNEINSKRLGKAIDVIRKMA